MERGGASWQQQMQNTVQRNRESEEEKRKGKGQGGGGVIVHLAGSGKAGRRREDSLNANNLCECQRRDGKQHIHIPLSP